MITRGGYALLPNYADVFKPANKFSSESLWEVCYKTGLTDNLGSPFYTAFAPLNYAPSVDKPDGVNYSAPAIAVKGLGNCVPTGYFIDFTKSWDSMWPDYDYEAREFDGEVYSDLRISNGEKQIVAGRYYPVNTNKDYPQSAEFPYDPFTGTTWVMTRLGYSGDNEYMCGKYQSPSGTIKDDSDDNWYILRYADVLLMMAEVENELSEAGLSQEVMDKTLNAVRLRAGIIPYTTTGDSGEAWVLDSKEKIRDAIQDERRLELSFEGHRWFDLVHTGKAVDVMNAHFEAYFNAFVTNTNPNSVNRYYMKNRKVVIDNKCMLFPIPTTEILVNPQLTQNEGAR